MEILTIGVALSFAIAAAEAISAIARTRAELFAVVSFLVAKTVVFATRLVRVIARLVVVHVVQAHVFPN